MKKSELKQIIREEYKKLASIKEAFSSSILQNLRYAGKRGEQTQFIRQMQLQWDKLTDQDLVKITPAEARTNKYQNAFIFWMSGGVPIALSSGKTVWYDTSATYWGRHKSANRSSKQLVSDSEFCIAIPEDVIKKYRSGGIRADRFDSRQDALALKRDSEVRDANLNRYKNIIAKKKSENSDIDTKIKAIMNIYQEEFTELTKNADWLKVRYLGENIKKLMDLYSRFAYISADLQKGKAYDHQTVEMTNIINNIKKLYSQLLNK